MAFFRRSGTNLLGGVLLLASLAGCKYLLLVDTTDAQIFFAFSSDGHARDGDGDRTVEVMNARASVVRSLAVAEPEEATATRVAWNLRDDAGNRVPAGSYSARLLLDGVVVEEAAPVYVSSP